MLELEDYKEEEMKDNENPEIEEEDKMKWCKICKTKKKN